MAEELNENQDVLLAMAGKVSTDLQEIIKQRHETGAPVILEDDGKVVGVIGDHEIYEGILSHGNG